jgi:hypothetical protein
MTLLNEHNETDPRARDNHMMVIIRTHLVLARLKAGTSEIGPLREPLLTL